MSKRSRFDELSPREQDAICAIVARDPEAAERVFAASVLQAAKAKLAERPLKGDGRDLGEHPDG